jgi:hypothetical protein
VTATAVGGGRPGRLTNLSRQECLRLLGSVPLGRIVFTLGALPAIRPVNHALVDDDIVIRTQLGSSIGAGARRGGVVVAYEADDIDLSGHTGWSVVVTGIAELVRDPGELARYADTPVPWVDQPTDCVIRIRPELVNGYRLDPADTPDTPAQDA